MHNSPESDGIVLAFDFGLKRIGVAIGNTLTQKSRPLLIINAESNKEKFAKISALISEWAPILFVVGQPFYPDGNPHEMTYRCQRFANQLRGRFAIDTVLVDERFSSAAAEKKSDEYIDDQSATLILQQYFDEQAKITS